MQEDKDKKEEKKNSWAVELEKRREKLERQKEMQKPDKELAKGAGRTRDKSGFTRSRRSTQGGGSTLEIFVAFVVITLAITGVMMVVFGNQSFALDTKLTQRALYHAERGVEHAFASSTADFSSLASGFLALSFGSLDDVFASTTPSGDDYHVGINVTPISECVKRVESNVGWGYDVGNRDRAATISSLFTSVEESQKLGGDCVSEETPDDWDNPEGFPTEANLIHAGNQSTDVDVISRSDGRFAILTTEDSEHDTLWMLNVTNPQNPNSFDIVSYDTESDLWAVSATHDYAFVVGATSTTQGQLRVFDISGGALSFMLTYDLLGVGGERPAGVSVYYYDNHVYVGTKRTEGNELHIFDVSGLPSSIEHKDSIEVNRNVNDIVVRDGLAYLATGPGTAGPPNPLKIYDVDPISPTYLQEIGKFETTGNFEGTSLYVLGNKAYLGRAGNNNSEKDFQIIDIEHPANPTELGSKKLNFTNADGSAVVGVVVHGNIAFLANAKSSAASNKVSGLEILNVSNPTVIKRVLPCSEVHFAQDATGIDFIDNMVFISSKTNAALRIFYDLAGQCNE